MQHDPPTVSEDLTDTSDDHAEQEAPSLVLDTLKDVDQHGDGEEGDEASAGGQLGLVVVETELDRAHLERAILVWSIGDITVRRFQELTGILNAVRQLKAIGH